MSELKTFECEDSYRLGHAMGAMAVINSDYNETECEETDRYKMLKKIYNEICCNDNKSGESDF